MAIPRRVRRHTPRHRLTFASLAALLSFRATYCIIYALSHPLSDLCRDDWSSVAFGSV